MALFVPYAEILAIVSRRILHGNLQMTNGNGVPTDGVTGAGTLKKGGCYLNTATNLIYLNVGSKASPRYQVFNK